MPSVWQERFAQYLKHVLNLRESTELSVLPDLMPVLPVADANAPELAWYRGEARFISWYAVAPVVGNFSTFSMKVHDPGFIAVIEHASIIVAAATPLRFSFGAADLTLVSPEDALDRRSAPPPKARLRLSQGATAGLSSPCFSTYPALALTLPVPVVLGQGSYLIAQCETANTECIVRVVWRERSVAGTSEG